MNVSHAQKIISQPPPVKPALASVVPVSAEKLGSMPKVVKKAVAKVHNHQVHKFEKKLNTYNQARELTGHTPLEPYLFNPGMELGSFWWKNDSRTILNPTVSASS